MIKARELRIGNLVNVNGVAVECISISKSYVDVLYTKKRYDIESTEPIPLTEEWLLKFGFERYDDLYWFLPNYPSYEICPNEPLQLFLPCETTDESEYCIVKDNDCKIQYVHQLQNIYFALTGEELCLK